MLKSKNIEVEIRALIPNFDNLSKKLLNLGADYCGVFELHDIYFCPQAVNTLEEVEMNKVGSYSLRIRKESKEGGEVKTYLNTKTITNHGDHNAWEEHEVAVNDFKEMQSILLNIGFKSFFELKKKRFQYKISDLNVFLDDISDFGACIEIEKIVLAGEEKGTKKDILKFLASLGISEEQIVTKSVTNMVMKERVFI